LSNKAIERSQKCSKNRTDNLYKWLFTRNERCEDEEEERCAFVVEWIKNNNPDFLEPGKKPRVWRERNGKLSLADANSLTGSDF
jgi:hypothetical protein